MKWLLRLLASLFGGSKPSPVPQTRPASAPDPAAPPLAPALEPAVQTSTHVPESLDRPFTEVGPASELVETPPLDPVHVQASGHQSQERVTSIDEESPVLEAWTALPVSQPPEPVVEDVSLLEGPEAPLVPLVSEPKADAPVFEPEAVPLSEADQEAVAEPVPHELVMPRTAKFRYLGPGVSSRLNLHVADGPKLQAAGLPILQTPEELAEALGITVNVLRWLAFHNELATRVHYVRFEIAKRSGGTRTLMAPHRELARVQRWIFENILGSALVHDASHGFVKGRGTVSNAQRHCGQEILINLDLKDFFPSVGFHRVRAVFERIGYSPSVATVLGLLCTECPRATVERDGLQYHAACGPLGLPQGACTSPTISNLVAQRLDRRLTGLAGTVGATYTRYADDLSFSGGPELAGAVGAFLSRIRHVVHDEGFQVHPDKTRVLRKNAAQLVTGLVVNDRPKVARTEIRRLRAILHRARFDGLDAQNREKRPEFRNWLRGKIAYIAMSDPKQGEALLAQFKAVDSPSEA